MVISKKIEVEVEKWYLKVEVVFRHGFTSKKVNFCLGRKKNSLFFKILKTHILRKLIIPT